MVQVRNLKIALRLCVLFGFFLSANSAYSSGNGTYRTNFCICQLDTYLLKVRSQLASGKEPPVTPIPTTPGPTTTNTASTSTSTAKTTTNTGTTTKFTGSTTTAGSTTTNTGTTTTNTGTTTKYTGSTATAGPTTTNTGTTTTNTGTTTKYTGSTSAAGPTTTNTGATTTNTGTTTGPTTTNTGTTTLKTSTVIAGKRRKRQAVSNSTVTGSVPTTTGTGTTITGTGTTTTGTGTTTTGTGTTTTGTGTTTTGTGTTTTGTGTTTTGTGTTITGTGTTTTGTGTTTTGTGTTTTGTGTTTKVTGTTTTGTGTTTTGTGTTTTGTGTTTKGTGTTGAVTTPKATTKAAVTGAAVTFTPITLNLTRDYIAGIATPTFGVAFDSSFKLVDDYGVIFDANYTPSLCNCTIGQTVEIGMCLLNVPFNSSYSNINSSSSNYIVSKLLPWMDQIMITSFQSSGLYIRTLPNRFQSYENTTTQLFTRVDLRNVTFKPDFYVNNAIYSALNAVVPPVNIRGYDTNRDRTDCLSVKDVTPVAPKVLPPLYYLRYIAIPAAIAVLVVMILFTCVGKKDKFYIRFW